jgi:hypothetical protein
MKRSGVWILGDLADDDRKLQVSTASPPKRNPSLRFDSQHTRWVAEDAKWLKAGRTFPPLRQRNCMLYANKSG